MPTRTGSQYLEGLKDDRKVIFEGQAIDVTTAAGFASGARAVAAYYDFQSLAAHRDTMTYETPEGSRAGMSFCQVRTKDELRRRASAHALWAEVNVGFMGRSPDYMNTCMASVGSAAGALAEVKKEYGERAKALYLDARERDACMTHTFVNVQGHDSKAWVASETPEGMKVSGIRGVATLAPFADLNLNLGAHVDADKVPYNVSFVHPVAMAGTMWVARDPMSQDEDEATAPLASRFDEIDCSLVFDDALIPNDGIFCHAKGLEMVLLSRELPLLRAALRHHVLTRSIVKQRFLIALAHMLAESAKLVQFGGVREALGEMLINLRSAQAFASAAVEESVTGSGGFLHANPDVLTTAMYLNGKWMQFAVDTLTSFGAGRFVSSPQERTFDALGEVIEGYFRGATASGREVTSLHRLAWDVVGRDWGRRSLLYEQFNQGPPAAQREDAYMVFRRNEDVKAEALALVSRILRRKTSP